MSFHWPDHYAARASRMEASEIRELLKLLSQPDIISFAGGIPDPRYFPATEIAGACQRILSDPARAAVALQYAVSEGYLPLREWLVTYMAELGVACDADNIIITNGSQQALDFLGKLFISPGDTVLMGWPTYLGALQAFNAYEPLYDRLPGDDARHPANAHEPKSAPKFAPKFAYVTPEFQNPTGISLTLKEREKLLDAALAMDLPIIEDNPYEKLRYDGDPIPPILALAARRAGSVDNANVIYCGSFSKSVAPALRIGWAVGPRDVIRKLVLINQASSLHVSPLTQMIMHDVAPHIIETHTGKVRAAYKARRDAMLQALAAHMPGDVRWTKPEGGMFVWMTLPEAMDSAELLRRAIAEARVAFVPGAAFFPDRSGKNTLRLNFSLNDPSAIEEGISRLGALLKDSLGKK